METTVEQLVARTAEHVKEALGGDSSGHDWWHAHRVWTMAARIGHEEAADPLVVALAAIVHDLGDAKLTGFEPTPASHPARALLTSLGATPEIVDHVVEIACDLSFKGADVPTPMPTIEGRVVQDADRLDALGAIGIARAFAYGGSRGQPIYTPGETLGRHRSLAEYRGSTSSTVGHFHEKLLLLRDRMNTPSGRRIADARHAYLETFLAEFHREWSGEA
jgi:uncharacterized protein